MQFSVPNIHVIKAAGKYIANSTTHYCFCTFSIFARILGKLVSVTVEMAVVVSAAVDVADIVAIAGVAVCAL